MMDADLLVHFFATLLYASIADGKFILFVWLHDISQSTYIHIQASWVVAWNFIQSCKKNA